MPPAPANTNKPCPVCGKPADAKFRPFCSRRCADVDLHRWLGGAYRVETDEAGETGGNAGDDDV
ncbi:DNA gyrase inhibitor YacG [Magnetospirillum sp. UT-4]|uniref:DNA gyrase inhibitor YacG n=1 Tax=Magnetospirillum sp. UT-4 TaxID=2681467 RepID=UPI00137C7BEE|nr:DNA gyrase inhibitor YacG [Magnetospirillum sp. UT-4]CAA7622754.1 DNA gyrase inhibitor YacG [Magnetospirillum sp. UT-4]